LTATVEAFARAELAASTTGWHWLALHPPPRQPCPQEPQFDGLLVVSTQLLPHSVGLPEGQPDTQAKLPPCGAQEGVDPEQICPHAPQFELVEIAVAHPPPPSEQSA
jgi:hypothetical protein